MLSPQNPKSRNQVKVVSPFLPHILWYICFYTERFSADIGKAWISTKRPVRPRKTARINRDAFKNAIGSIRLFSIRTRPKEKRARRDWSNNVLRYYMLRRDMLVIMGWWPQWCWALVQFLSFHSFSFSPFFSANQKHTLLYCQYFIALVNVFV